MVEQELEFYEAPEYTPELFGFTYRIDQDEDDGSVDIPEMPKFLTITFDPEEGTWEAECDLDVASDVEMYGDTIEDLFGRLDELFSPLRELFFPEGK